MFRHPFFSVKNTPSIFLISPFCKKFHVFVENWQRNNFPKLYCFYTHVTISPIIVMRKSDQLRSVNHLLLEWEDVDNAWCKFGESGDWGTIVSDEGSGLRIAYWTVSSWIPPCSSFEIFSFSPDYFSIQLRNIDPKKFQRHILYIKFFPNLFHCPIVLAQILNVVVFIWRKLWLISNTPGRSDFLAVSVSFELLSFEFSFCFAN